MPLPMPDFTKRLRDDKTVVDRRQVRVHVGRVAVTTQHLHSCNRDLSQGVYIGGRVRKNDKVVLFPGVCEMLRSRHCQPRRGIALDCLVATFLKEPSIVMRAPAVPGENLKGNKQQKLLATLSPNDHGS